MDASRFGAGRNPIGVSPRPSGANWRAGHCNTWARVFQAGPYALVGAQYGGQGHLFRQAVLVLASVIFQRSGMAGDRRRGLVPSMPMPRATTQVCSLNCIPSIISATGDRAVAELIRLAYVARPRQPDGHRRRCPRRHLEGCPKAAPDPGACLQLPNLSMSLSVLPGPVGVKAPRAHSEVVPGIKVRSPADATNPAWPGTAVRVSRPLAKWTKL